MKDIYVNTTTFEAEYDRAPRGTGVWAFRIKGCADGHHRTLCHTGKYGEAKLEAKRQAAKFQATEIEVLP